MGCKSVLLETRDVVYFYNCENETSGTNVLRQDDKYF